MTQCVFLLSFLMAFLLFAVQPMATKMVLPFFGGTPAVWNTAMLTFQLLLLAGYGYAHTLAKLKPRQQLFAHALLVLVSLIVLPLAIPLTEDGALLAHPIRNLISAFMLHLGVPFFVLSATAPLLQAWVSRSTHPLANKPYVLYSASNLGSLVALIGYLIFVEPYFTLTQQSALWSFLYVVGTSALLMVGWRLSPRATVATATTGAQETISMRRMGLWVFLAFLSSALCLSVTSFLTTDIAAVPLLWIVPLAIYLLSFVDAFRERPLLVHTGMRIGSLCGVAALILYALQYINLVQQFLLHILFFTVMVFGANGWLAQLRPGASQLTKFYFCMAIGGALGGVFNAILAPLVFSDIIEYPLTLLIGSLSLFLLWQQRDDADFSMRAHVRIMGRVLLATLAIASCTYLIGARLMQGNWAMPWDHTDYQLLFRSTCFATLITLVLQRRYVNAFYGSLLVCMMIIFSVESKLSQHTVFRERNFFGVVRVDISKDRRYLFHNTTMHSYQNLHEAPPPKPTTYYAKLTDIFALPAVMARPYAVIGLGAGTMKCYAKPSQQVDFFEINPVVLTIAEGTDHFTFLHDCLGAYTVHLGDGRIMIGHAPAGRFGLIALDAFSSDAIPAHLLTREAFSIYLEKLAPHGVILVHTTNRYLNLWPLLAAQAKAMGMVAYGRNYGDSLWAILARNEGDLAALRARDDQWALLSPPANDHPWTDHYTNLLPYFMIRWPRLTH